MGVQVRGPAVKRKATGRYQEVCLAYLCLWGEGQQQVALVQPDIHQHTRICSPTQHTTTLATPQDFPASFSD